jgi:hypothetical protein
LSDGKSSLDVKAPKTNRRDVGGDNLMRVIAAVAACVSVGACSTIIEGRSQQILVNTNPSGADCGLYRQNVRIATVQNAPGSALIEKTKHDMWIVCVKQGYQMATFYNHSGAAGATFGNIILGGGIGWAIDSASGADNKYESPVNITLVPNIAGQADGPVTLPPTFIGTLPSPAAPQSTPDSTGARPAPAAPAPSGKPTN